MIHRKHTADKLGGKASSSKSKCKNKSSQDPGDEEDSIKFCIEGMKEYYSL